MSQAVSAPITGQGVTTGGKSAFSTELSAGMFGRESPSRRAVLTGAGLAMLVPAAMALPVAAATTNCMAWNKALARQQSTDAAHKAACLIHSKAQERYYAARKTWRTLGVQWAGTEEAHNARVVYEKAMFDRMEADCRRGLRLDELEAASDEALNVSGDALDNLIATAAPNLSAVIVKIELAVEYGMDVSELQPVLADLRRLEAAA